MKRYLMKNPHWTPEQERQIETAERLSTRAQIFELGAAAYLKDHMPLAHHIEEIQEVLGLSLSLRRQSNAIHESLRPSPRSRKSQPSSKALAKQKRGSK
jgi:hypothetical protein